MSSPLEAARAEVAQLEREQDLADAMNAAAAAHEESGGDAYTDTYAAHNRAQEALADHRRQMRLARQPKAAADGDATAAPSVVEGTVGVHNSEA